MLNLGGYDERDLKKVLEKSRKEFEQPGDDKKQEKPEKKFFEGTGTKLGSEGTSVNFSIVIFI